MKFTPENVTELAENEVFVFGSNARGMHAGGAARMAYEKFGAEWGVGDGRTGQCYAFRTLGHDFEKVPPDSIITSKCELYAYAKHHPELTFLVTKIGCGIAGFTVDEMRQVFAGDRPFNVIIPKEFSQPPSPERPVEMTLEEIEKALGKKIKIVEGK